MDFSNILLTWFRENGRDLPWRGTQDPYAIWLSEIILQQTQVKQGWDYWERFMHRWPTVEDLAAATEDEVLREWQGLGYYSRARNLHFAAKQIVEMGGFPQTIEGLRSLKGVGDYTAAAIGSIAFGLPAAVVDGNVYRVLARHFGIDTPINSTEGKNTFAALAQNLLPTHCAGTYNQAIMDFGAIQCTPASPSCSSCPLMESCDAFRTGRVGQLPVKKKTLQVRERHLSYIYIRCKGYVAIHRRGPGDIWQGLWEPFLESEAYKSQIDGVQIRLREGVKHVLTHQVLLADFSLLITEKKPQLPSDYIWVSEDELDKYGVPRLVERLFREVRLYDKESRLVVKEPL